MSKYLAIFLSVAAASLTTLEPIFPRAPPNNFTEGKTVLLVSGYDYVKLVTFDGKAFDVAHTKRFQGHSWGLIPDYENSAIHVPSDDGNKTRSYKLLAGAGAIGDEAGSINETSIGHLAWSFKKEGRNDDLLALRWHPTPDILVYNTSVNSSTLSLHKQIPINDLPLSANPSDLIDGQVHPNSIILEPLGRFYIIPLRGADMLLIVDASTHEIAGRQQVPIGCAPRHGAFWNPQFLIIVCYKSSAILLFDVSITRPNVTGSENAGGDSRLLSKLQYISAYSPNYPPKNASTAKCGSLIVAPRAGQPDVADVYVSNRFTGNDSDSISHFEISSKNPVLVWKDQISTKGLGPLGMTLDDTGKTIFVTNQYSGGNTSFGLVALNRAPSSGQLMQTNGTATLPTLPWTEFGTPADQGSGPNFIMQWTTGKGRIQAAYPGINSRYKTLLVTGKNWIESVIYNGTTFQTLRNYNDGYDNTWLAQDVGTQRFFWADAADNETSSENFNSSTGRLEDEGQSVSLGGLGISHLLLAPRQGPKTQRLLLGASPNFGVVSAFNTSQNGSLSLHTKHDINALFPNSNGKARPIRTILDPTRKYYLVLLQGIDTILALNAKDLSVASNYTLEMSNKCNPIDGVFPQLVAGEGLKPQKPTMLILCGSSDVGSGNRIVTVELKYNETGLAFRGSMMMHAYPDVSPPANITTARASVMKLVKRTYSPSVKDLYIAQSGTGNTTDFITHGTVYIGIEGDIAVNYQGVRYTGGTNIMSMDVDEAGTTLFVTNNNGSIVLAAFPRHIGTGDLAMGPKAAWGVKDFATMKVANDGPNFVASWMG